MRNAAKTLVALTTLSLAACGSSEGDQQHNADNAVEVNSSVIEVNTLPADESSATSSEDLAEGATGNETGNGY